MVYNERMDKVLINLFSDWENITKKKMFGGTGYLLNGNMLAGIHKDFYILRMGEDNAKKALNNQKMKLFDITGRAMKGWIMAGPEAFNNKNELKKWVEVSKEFVDTLPPK